MSKIKFSALPSTLILSVLLLSACATEPKATPSAPSTPVATQAPAVVAAAPVEEPAKPAVAPEPAPAPLAVAETPAPKPKAHKARKKIAKPVPVAPVTPPEPVAAAPAPVVPQEPPAVQPPAPQPAIIPPVKTEEGFLEKNWLWLLGLVVVIAGIAIWRWIGKGNKS
jgi:hypothetical protein